MNKKTLDYVRALTETDEKNLCQKTLKLTEEVGELAKVILPYENAFATTHRFVDRERILEELADVFLCQMSLVYDMGFDDEDFERMVNHKMKFWADLQARERKLGGKAIPYEIHITVDADGDLDRFKYACQLAEVKPILLDLHLQDGAVIKDLMTSSVFMGNNRDAFLEMKRIVQVMETYGFEVLREKIETIPWHPAAPSWEHERTEMPPNCYFECHLAVLTTADTEEKLTLLANSHYAHKSRNVFKRNEDGSYTVMITLRTYEGVFETFEEKVQKLKRSLNYAKFGVAKEIVEFSIYDTKVSHDSAWISGVAGG